MKIYCKFDVAFNILVGLVFLIIGFSYYTWSSSSVLASLGGDNAAYILMSQYYSLFDNTSGVVRYYVENSHYPPIYPLILAMSGASNDLNNAHFITTTCLLLTMLGMFYWGVLSKLDKRISLLMIILFAILPGTYFQALYILSENAYLLFVVGAFVATTKYEITRNNNWLYATVFFLSLATLTRSAGISLIPAFVLYCLINKPPKRIFLSVLSICPYLIWKLFSGRSGEGYVSLFFSIYGEQPLQVLKSRVFDESVQIWYGWLNNFSDSPADYIGLTVISLLLFAGTLFRIKQKKLDGFYVVFYLALLIIWPYSHQNTRFMYVLTPICLFQGFYLLKFAVSRIEKFKLRIIVPYVFALIILIDTIPKLLITYSLFSYPLESDIEPYRQTNVWYMSERGEAVDNIKAYKVIFESMKLVDSLIPKDQCVLSIKPRITGLYSNRLSYSYPEYEEKKLNLIDSIKNVGCSYLYMVHVETPAFEAYYPMDSLEGYVDIIQVFTINTKRGRLIISALGKLNDNA